MTAKVFRQESKEFQMKVLWPVKAGKTALVPGITDQQIFRHVTRVIAAAVTRLAEGHKIITVFNDNLWRRDGVRYDTAAHDLKRHNLTLAIEATDERTKLKCKQHSFVPELLFDKPKHSICFPDIDASGVYKKHDSKLKREQDVHFSNVKYCASGSLFVKGRAEAVDTLGFFSAYFPALTTLLPAATSLSEVSRWDEAVFDDMLTSWNKIEFSSWMLVNRWNTEGDTLLESELSFKVDKEMNADWDEAKLRRAAQLYLELQKTGAFQPVPPIFFFNDPVSSTPVRIETV